MFSIAIEWGEATTNPVSVVRKTTAGTQAGGRADRAGGGGDGCGANWAAMATCGRRRWSACWRTPGCGPARHSGLELRHIRERTILVEQAVSDGEMKVQKTGRMYRTVDLLRAFRVRSRVVGLRSTGICDGDTLLFAKPDGGAWRTDDWNNWRNRRFFPSAEAAGLGHPRPYDLRHSFASLMIREQRASIVELAEQLGHAPTMTLNTYAHVFAETPAR